MEPIEKHYKLLWFCFMALKYDEYDGEFNEEHARNFKSVLWFYTIESDIDAESMDWITTSPAESVIKVLNSVRGKVKSERASHD